MFKGKAFQVKVVNAEESDETQAQEPLNVNEITNSVTRGAAILIGVYMASDTIRQIAIHAAKANIK